MITLGYEWALIAWLYAFGAAGMAVALNSMGKLTMIDFFMVVMWPVLFPVWAVVRVIYEIFD